MTDLFAELRRRNIFKVAAAYAVLAWLLSQVAVTMETALGLPDAFDAVVVSALLIGFPIALVLAWAFELTPEGVVRTPLAEGAPSTHRRRTGRRLMGVIGAGLIAAVAWLGLRGFNGAEPSAAAPALTRVPAATLASPAASVATIAVLPFEDLSPLGDQGYFASGISEELLNVLSRIDGLRVSSRTSAFALGERKAGIAEIADALGVRHVVEGSVRKAGDTLRITAVLIDAKSDAQSWSGSYDRPLTAENIFAIQDEITAAIVAELKGELDIGADIFPDEPGDRTDSVEAYELYLRALEKTNLRTADSLQAAITTFEDAIRIDPDFAPAHSGLADAHLLTYSYGGVSQSDAVAAARPHVERALDLAPDSAEALTSSAEIARFEGDYDTALALIERAIAANPSYANAHFRHSLILTRLSRPQDAFAAVQAAVALDPLSAVLLSTLASSQYNAGDFDAALATSERNMKYNPDRPFGHFMRGLISWVTGDLPAGHADLQNAYVRSPRSTAIRSNLSGLYQDAGMTAQARAMAGEGTSRALFDATVGEVDAARAVAETLNPGDAANIYFQLRDYERARPAVDTLVENLRDGGRVNLDGAYFGARSLAAADRLGLDAEARRIGVAIEDYLAGREPGDIRDAVTLYVAVSLALHQGDPDGALAWIDRAHALRIPLFNLDVDPVFDPLRDHPGFADRLERQAAIAAAHRTAILAQLADPGDGWLVVD